MLESKDGRFLATCIKPSIDGEAVVNPGVRGLTGRMVNAGAPSVCDDPLDLRASLDATDIPSEFEACSANRLRRVAEVAAEAAEKGVRR